MLAAGFATLSGLGYGLTSGLVQMGMRGRKVTVAWGLMISLIAATALLLVAVAVVWTVDPPPFSWAGVLHFAAAGATGPLLGRAAFFIAIGAVGATRTASIVMSETLFAAAIAYILLGQTISALSAAGIVVLVVGLIAFVNASGPETQTTAITPTTPPEVPDNPSAVSVTPPDIIIDDSSTAGIHMEDPATGHPFRLAAGIGLSMIAAGFFAVSAVFRQLGVIALPSALIGAAVGTVVALIVTGAYLAATGQIHTRPHLARREMGLFALSGVAASFGLFFFLLALEADGTVAVSTALKSLSPLFTFFFAVIFLARTERLTLRLAILVLVICAGAALTAIGRG